MATKKAATKTITTKKPTFQTPLRVGANVLIRTVTHYYTGHVEEVGEHEILLSLAAWIPDTGRFSECVSKGTVSEVEPYPGPIAVGRGAIVDVSEWIGELPRGVR